MKARVVNPFNGLSKGDIVDFNDRRFKSELRNGNIEEVKLEKVTYQNKAYKRKKK